ncbi:uncharacterized protein LOC120915968 [Rana temporaria]|uniref:uncharacterized protein LOC120915968 n=1 Tax=Rana temporaria TaxID=8407 RepID=UPI001AAC7DF4|nr:uncharacterized protein LOC120915968 [Rana temporaria]
MPRKSMASLNLLALLFLSYFCFGDCAISLEQPSILFAAVGSTIDLNCHLKSDEQLTRINLYWFRIGLNGTLKKYLYPPRAVPSSSISRASSISLLHPNHSTDMSLSVSNLTLAHTDTYVCHVSLVVGMNNSAVSGSGTFLLVHEPLETSLNESDLTCTTTVQTVTDVTLVWEHENDVTLGDPGWLANSDHSYWISNTFPNSTSLCHPPQNLTFTCHLQYKGTAVASKRMEVTCAGLGEAHQPILLYSLILGSSLLILLVLLLIWIRNKWIFRTNPDSSLYTNISDLKRSYCL